MSTGINLNTPKSPNLQQTKINSTTTRLPSERNTKTELFNTKFSEKSFSTKKIDISNLYFTSTYLKTSPTYKQAINKIIFQKSDTKYIKFLDEEVSRNKNRSRSILKSSIIEKSASSYKKTDPTMNNLTKEESMPEFLTTKSVNEGNKVLFAKTTKFGSAGAMTLTTSNLDLFKTGNNSGRGNYMSNNSANTVSLFDAKTIGFVKYLKEIKILK